jgi:hypothetical protein
VLRYRWDATHQWCCQGWLVIFDGIEWDDRNLDHACRRVNAAEIEQVIANATSYRPHRGYRDRVLFTARLTAVSTSPSSPATTPAAA